MSDSINRWESQYGDSPNGRKRAADEIVLNSKDELRYRAPRQFYHELLVEELPIFTLWIARVMLRDPAIRIGLTARNSALQMVKWKVAANDPKVAKYVDALLHDMWKHHGKAIRRTKQWGYNALSVGYERDGQTGFLKPTDVKEFAPQDVRCVRRKLGRPVGFTVRNTHGAAKSHMRSTFGTIMKYMPQAIWLTYDSEWQDPYGHAILRGSYSSWYEKWMPAGYRKLRQLRMMKDGYIGDVMQVPFEKGVTLPDGTQTNYVQLCREASENRLAGATVIIPKLTDENGNDLITYEPPQDSGNPSGIYQWGDDLDDDILQGLGVFKEVIEASETGSGFSGRSVPMMMFLQSCQEEWEEYLACIEHYMLKPLVWLHFGPRAQFSVETEDIVKTLASQSQGSAIGGSAIGTQPSQAALPGPRDDQQDDETTTQFAFRDAFEFLSHDKIDQIVTPSLTAVRKWRQDVADKIRTQSRSWFGQAAAAGGLAIAGKWIAKMFREEQPILAQIVEDALVTAVVVGQADVVEAYEDATPKTEQSPPDTSGPIPEMPAFPRQITVGGHVHEREPVVTDDVPPRTPEPPPKEPMGRKPVVRFPVGDEASRRLKARPVATGEHYLQTAELVKSGSFAITADLADSTVEEIKQLVDQAVDMNLDRKQFVDAVNKLLSETGEHMTDAHIELVLRANVQAYMSDAAEHALSNPIVGGGMPYRAQNATHDDRVRETHEAVETSGIDGTNVYRWDDPVWHAFRAPFDYNCRCGWRPLSIRQAAQAGVGEARLWLARAERMAREKGGRAASHFAATAPLDKAFVPWPTLNGEPIVINEAWRRNGVPVQFADVQSGRKADEKRTRPPSAQAENTLEESIQLSEGWLTLGGGSPAYVQDGEIVLGCPGLKGYDIDELGDTQPERAARKKAAKANGLTGEDASPEQFAKMGETYRQKNAKAQQAAEGFEFGANTETHNSIGVPSAKTAIGKIIREHASSPQDGKSLYDIIMDVWKVRSEHIAEYNDAWYEVAANTHASKREGSSAGVELAGFVSMMRRAADPTKVAGFDNIVQTVRNNPSLASVFAREMGSSTGTNDLEAIMFDAMKRGPQKTPPVHDPEIVRMAVEEFERIKYAGPSRSSAQLEAEYGQFADVDDAAKDTERNPTDAQRDAGNYRKGKFQWNGMTITIETPKGVRRRPEWPPMPAHYGYVNRTEGVDGDHLDVFVGPDEQSDNVVVIHQVDENGEYDEDKVMIGYGTTNEAIDAYRSAYTEDWKVGPHETMTVEQFKEWVRKECQS